MKKSGIVKNFFRLTEDGIIIKTKTYDYIPYEYYGDGLKVLLNTIYHLIKAKGRILLIEEPENHLHPGYLKIFIEVLFEYSKRYNIQIFMTSHSYDLIKELIDQSKNKKREKEVLISRLVASKEKIDKFDYTTSQASKIIHELNMDLRGI